MNGADVALQHLGRRLAAREVELAVALGKLAERDAQLEQARQELAALQTEKP